MGNCSCIDRSAVVSWADDDWDEWELMAAGGRSPGRPAKKEQHQQQQLKERLLSSSPSRVDDPHHHRCSGPLAAAAEDTASAAGTHEVKIKISKRQLQELVGKTGGEGVEVLRQALQGLLGSTGPGGDQMAREAAQADDAGHGHHWRPNLQSIPEGPE